MLGKKIINTGGVACTTDTTQILDGGTTQSTALYRFEDNAFDTSESTGKFGKGASFDGYNSKIEASNVSALNNATAVSVSLWFNWDDSASVSNYNHMVNIGIGGNSAGDDFGIAIGDDGGAYQRVLYGYFPDGSTSTGQTVTANTWHHVVMVYDGPSVKYYYDGSLISTMTKTSLSLPSSGVDIDMGHYKYNGNHHFKGLLDQIRVFNKAVSASEVTTLYNETTTTVNTLQVLGDTSCVAAYTFEGNANDLSTNYSGTATNVIYDYNGTASNVTYAAGKFDKAAVFNGTNSYIYASNPVQQPTTNFSVSVWSKWDSKPSGSVGLVGNFKSGVNPQVGFVLAKATGLNVFGFWADGTATNGNVQGTTNFVINRWYHVVGTYDGSNIKIYVDGQLEGTQAYTATPGTTDQPLVIGRWYGNYSGYYHDGSIDQVRIFDKSLSPGEINSLYNETTTTAALGTISNPSTVAYYKMADATDETGSYNGVATNVDFNVVGKYGFAGKFNGSSSKIVLPNNYLIPQNNFTISCWINTANVSQLNQMIWSYQSPTSGRCFLQMSYSSSGALRVYTSLGNQNITSQITSNTWYHLVFVKSSTAGLILYKNGSAILTRSSDTGDIALSTVTATDANIIGAYKTTAVSNYFYGKIDQFRVFNKAISADEVTKLYNEIQCTNTITTPESYFQTKLYTGNGNTQALTGVGFTPGLTWVKARDAANDNVLVDSINGAGSAKGLVSNATYTEGAYTAAYGYISSLDNDGFTVSTGSSYANYTNKNNDNYVAWNWKAGSSNTTNNDGTIQSTVRASQESGFSIVKATFNTSSPQKIGHGLNSAPEFIISKRTSTTSDWNCYHKFIDASAPEDYLIKLNSSDARSNNSIYWNDTAPTSSVFTTGSIYDQNETVTFYCFHSVDGYQRIGSYVGNGSNNGPFIYTGFEPAWVIIKNADTAYRWYMLDNKRDTTNPNNARLFANAATAEATNSDILNFHTNGFELITSDAEVNKSGDKMIFMAIAANPDTTVPTKASSFNTKLFTPTTSSSALSVTGFGFKPDFVWAKYRNGAQSHYLVDSVRGLSSLVYSNTTNAAYTASPYVQSFDSDGITYVNNLFNRTGTDACVAWGWKAADHDRNLASINNDGSIISLVSANPAAGFSVVKWTGTGVDGKTIGHGLQGSPEMIITKGLSNATSWVVGIGGVSGMSVNDYLTLTTNAKGNLTNFYQAYSTNTFQVGVSAANEMNKSSSNQYISYCFRSISGISKLGTYTGTNAINTITTGFEPRFLMVKLTSAINGQWVMYDNVRSATNPRTKKLAANSSVVENDGGLLGGDSAHQVNFTSTGFELLETSGGVNTNKLNETYIYMAFK